MDGAGACWGLVCINHAYCEIRRSRLEPFPGTRLLVGRLQSRLIQLRQSLVEASDTRVVEVSRLPESHHDSTGSCSCAMRDEFSAAWAKVVEASRAMAAAP